MTTVVFWTPEKEKILKSMWAAGNSARDIGAVVGATRNAVLGKVHRMKLPTPKTDKTKHTPKPKPKAKRAAQAPSVAVKEEADKVYTAVREAVMSLGKGECRWPYGAPHEGKMAFCKEPVYESYSYCLKHCYNAFSNFEEARRERERLNSRRKTP